MSYKVDESILMAYLYDELSAEERGKVEAHLKEDEAARKELEELKEVRFLMGKLNDHEVEVPKFTFDQPTMVVASSWNSWWKVPMGIAASITLLLMIGYLTSFRISTGEGGFKVAFGESEPREEFYTKSQVESIVADALAANNQLVNQKLNDVENTLVTRVSKKNPPIDEDLMNEYMARLRDFNRETLRGCPSQG